MATQTLELEPDAFWRMVTEENLKTDGPSAGYMWTGKRGRNGWETYKTRAQPIGWAWQSRRVVTQDAAGGGVLVLNVVMPTGVVGRLIGAYFVGSASAGATLTVTVRDEDGAVAGQWATIAAGASRYCWVPSIGTAANTNNNVQNTTSILLLPGQTLNIISSAALQTETLTLYISLLLSVPTAPTITTTGSAGTPNLAASTISAENTMQAVYI